jgi:hypothetical protein
MRNVIVALAFLGLVACGGQESTQSTAPAADVAAPAQAAAPQEQKEEEAAAPAEQQAAPAEQPAALEDERTEE